ncbi:MAG: rhamnulokinase, partial [Lachnospiraceae bacterium]|nr:rhamnulokinase [Lachnospiraceae bacterium]
MRRYLAIDIGASSGRHIVGWTAEGSTSSPPAFETREVYRFANGVQRVNGHLIWDIPHLAEEVKRGIDLALAEYDDIVSLSVDTWGIDYVLLRGDEEVLPCYSYRDSRTQSVVDELHEKIPFSELYRRTGSQFQIFNSLYQWYWDMKEGRLEGVTDVLM